MDELKLFDAYMSGKGWTDNTKYTYSLIVKNFIEDNPAYKSYTSQEAREIINRAKTVRALKTVKQLTLALTAFYDCSRLDYSIWNFRIVPERRLPKYLSKEDISRILDAITERDIYSIRDKAMYELIYSSGLKTTEIVNLKLRQLSVSKMRIDLEKKRAYFGRKAKQALADYIEKRGELLPKTDNLFVNAQGTQISPQRIELRLKKYATNAGIPEYKITPMALRNSLAVHLFDSGADAKTIQKVMRYRRANHIGRFSELSECFRGHIEFLGYESL